MNITYNCELNSLDKEESELEAALEQKYLKHIVYVLAKQESREIQIIQFRLIFRRGTSLRYNRNVAY